MIHLKSRPHRLVAAYIKDTEGGDLALCMLALTHWPILSFTGMTAYFFGIPEYTEIVCTVETSWTEPLNS